MTAMKVFKAILGALIVYAGIVTLQSEAGWTGKLEGIPVILIGGAIAYLAFAKNPIRRGPD
jgi:hypothetical protein